MKTVYLLLTLVCLQCSSIFAQTHISGRIDTTLTREGSPYIVDYGDDGYDGALILLEGDTLIIEAGVEILFDGAYEGIQCFGGVILANGTEDDSILFDGYNERHWGGIRILWDDRFEEVDSRFSYCTFRRAVCSNDDEYGMLRLYGISTVLEYCTFEEVERSPVHIFCPREDELIVRGCRFIGREYAFWFWDHVDDNHPIIENCIFESCNIETEEYNLTISNCIFIDAYIYSPGPMVNNSIFIRSEIGWYNRNHDGDRLYEDAFPDISYNIFFPELDFWVDRYETDSLAGLGVMTRVNNNGDSTDVYGNLLLDPQLAGGEDFPDMYFLTEDSPCIDAGDPESDLDPDGTVADIGPFYFHQKDIEINPDTLLFETPEATDSASVTIRNTGLTTLTISSQAIAPDDSPFSVTDAEFEIEQDGEHTTWIRFAPGRAGEYEAVLTIASDDPDEEAVEVQIIGTALYVNESEDNAPLDFRIVHVYPNPFNSILQVTLSLPTASTIHAQILDLSGRKAADLYTGELTAGKHMLSWKADKQPSGIYLLHVSSDRGETDVQKVILVR